MRTTESYLAELPRHLTGDAVTVAKNFQVIVTLFESIPPCAEKAAGMRKLLEARECLIRAAEDETLSKFSERHGYPNADGNLVGRD